MEAEIRPGEHLDDLQDGYVLIQSDQSFRFGIDAVLLSSYAKVKPGETVLDLGTGTGILPILLAAKTRGAHFTGLEIQPPSADMAARSVRANGLAARISIVEGDIRGAAARFGSASFDVVVSNPPYMAGGHGLQNPDAALAVARHEVCCTFADVAAAAAGVLKDKGRLYLVHRPMRLAEIMTTLSHVGLEPKRLQLVHPYADKEPNLLLLEAVKGSRQGMRVAPPLVVYGAPGVYTKEVLAMYGHMKEGRG